VPASSPNRFEDFQRDRMRSTVLRDAQGVHMKSKFSVAFAVAATAVVWSGGEASAHRWHGHRGSGWGAAGYVYSHSYYPTYAYGPGFVYPPDYAAWLNNYAYFYQRRLWQ
jgi:hypothetical protein